MAARVRTVALVTLAAVALCCMATWPPAAGGAPPAPVIYKGPADLPNIALTFDDNFRPALALQCLGILRDRGVPATVFVTGMYVNGELAITRELAYDGFEIGDHSLTHVNLTKQSWDGLMREVGGGTTAFNNLTGLWTAPLFRPPGGATNSVVAAAAAAQGFAYVVNWDIDTEDWTGRSAADITRIVLSEAHNGAIVLMHLSAPHTWEALPGIIDGLRARGYNLVTVSQLLKGERRFVDVTSATSGRDAIVRLVDAGLMSGYSGDWFGPSDSITRAQLSKVAVLAAGFHTDEVDLVDAPSFVDVPPAQKLDGSYETFPFDFVEEAVRAGFIQGSTDGVGRRVFRPYQPLTRLQLAQIVARMARNLKGYPDLPSAEVAPFTDVPPYGMVDAALVSALGLMSGFGNGEFGPYQPAQRAHVALVVSRFLDVAAYVAPSTSEPAIAAAAADTGQVEVSGDASVTVVDQQVDSSAE